jgi:hypothetical protein
MFELFWVILLFALAFVLRRSLFAVLDHRRIRAHFAAEGGTVTDISSSPFQSSWPDRNREDVYVVIFRDRDGVSGTVYCKTSFREGVFVSDRSDEPLAMNLKKPPRGNP